jgi:hypothetical protein
MSSRDVSQRERGVVDDFLHDKKLRVWRTPGGAIRVSLCMRLKPAISCTRIFRKQSKSSTTRWQSGTTVNWRTAASKAAKLSGVERSKTTRRMARNADTLVSIGGVQSNLQMIDLAQKGFFPKGAKILYAHLGGEPIASDAEGHVREGDLKDLAHEVGV